MAIIAVDNLSTGRVLLALITAVYLLRLAAQVAVTPLGEGLDYWGHLAYIVFMAEQGRAPSPMERSVPDWVGRMANTVPGPDHSLEGTQYRAWAALDPAAREQVRARIDGDTTTTAYETTNYQSQHPPLYYWLLSGVYRAFPPALGLEARLYLLGLVSVGLAALALPGIYSTLRLYLDETPSLLALLALAWYPNLLPFLARVTNDTLAMPLLVWALYFCLRARASRQTRHVVAAGVLLGLACFAKTYALTLLPLYVLCAAAGENRRRIAWPNLWVAGLITVLSLGAFFALSLATTGHLIPLTEMRVTAEAPFVARLAAPLQVNLLWFFGGLVKGFWWAGYWSFVSPTWIFYLPLAAPAFIFLLRPRAGGAGRAGLDLRALWPHYAALALFCAGMLWHAALFSLEARLIGLERHSGNEGWYANVLLGSVTVIVCVLLRRRLSAAAFQRVLAFLVVFFVAWSALGLAGMVVYWGGAVALEHPLRTVRGDQFIPALLNPQTWANWLTLPGVLAPVVVTSLLPLLLALAGTAFALRRLTMRQPAAAPVLMATAEPPHT